MAEQYSFQTDIRKERKKRKLKKHLKIFGIILAILAFASAIFITRKAWIPYFDEFLQNTQDTIINDGTLEGGAFPIQLGDGSTSSLMKECDGNLVVSTDTYVSFYLDNAGKINDIQHTLSSPMLDTSDDEVLAYDVNGHSFAVMNKKEELYKKTLDNIIISAKISKSNYVAVVTKQDNYPSYLTVYNEKGEEIFKWSNGNRVLGFAFNESGSGCFISTFTSKAGKILSTITKLRFDKSEEVFESDSIDTTIYDIQEMSDGSLWAICEDKYVQFSSDGKTEKSYEYQSELISYSSNENVVSMIFNSVADDGNSSLVIIESGDEPKTIAVKNIAKKVLVNTTNTFVLTDKTVSVFNKRGNELAKADVTSDYVDMQYIDDNIFFLGYEDINKMEFEF